MKAKSWLFLLILITGLFSCDFIEDSPKDEIRKSFYTYSEIETKLKKIASSSRVATLETLSPGSLEGREILVIKISDNPSLDEDETSIRILANTHGDEKISGEIALKLFEYLVDNYDSSSTVQNIIDNNEIWIIPVVNPDGMENDSRYNINGVDLNRNFGANWESHRTSGPYAFSENETKAIKNLTIREEFSKGLTLHTGPASYGLSPPLVSYPPDSEDYNSYTQADTDTLKKMAEDYKTYNKDSQFLVTNGADWYSISGSCSDWSYQAVGMLELTVELTTEKTNDIDYNNLEDQIEEIWEDNLESILTIFN